MNHEERLSNDGSRIVLTKEAEDFTAYCGPECNGEVFLGGEVIGEAPRPTDAPFDVDIVFGERHPREGEVSDLIEELGPYFADDFDNRVDAVYDLIEESDDPLQAIMDTEADELL